MNTRTIDVRIPYEWISGDIMAQLASQLPVDRHRLMVDRLGEACSKAQAAKEISVNPRTIDRMLEDGRILPACEGTRVDVRSLADYIERRPEADREARDEKRRIRW